MIRAVPTGWSATTPFARRVAAIFVTRVARFILGFATSLILARFLGPTGRGAYAVATLAPTTLFNLGQAGLPSAMSYFAGQGRDSRALHRLALVLGLALTAVLLAATWLALPWLEVTVLRAAPPDLVRLALLSLPFQFLGAFSGAILIGRQTIRSYSFVVLGQLVLMLAGAVVFVGLLGWGVLGAVIANVGAAVFGALGMAVALRRTTGDETSHRGIGASELTGYAAKFYPASVVGFLNYRFDIFLLSALLGDPAAIGLYTLAVSLAELTFFTPDAVSTIFFPRVAGETRERADRMAPQISRFTLLVTSLSVLGLIPAAFVAVHLILPAFTGSLPPFLVILPGVMALSVSKVIASYVGGLGLPLNAAFASGTGLAVNVVANLLLIPPFGIMGAAGASLISYLVHASLFVTIASRLSGQSPLAWVRPTRDEWDRLVSGTRGVLGR